MRNTLRQSQACSFSGITVSRYMCNYGGFTKISPRGEQLIHIALHFVNTDRISIVGAFD